MDLKSIFAEHRTRNIFFAFLSWLIAFTVYTLTVAPTASFWDPAEYIAITHTLQVAHPPGSPFFALFGRIVSMFVPAEHVAWSINMISVTASAFTVMLLYLIIIRLVEEFRGSIDDLSFIDKIGTYGGAAFGALTFMFTHTQWFNAVEAEMYASSTFLTALVIWLALRWSAGHDKPFAERWLILIAYVFGIGIGVHLLNLLALFFVAMIIYFKYKTFDLKSFAYLVVGSAVAFLSIYPITIINLPNLSISVSEMTYGLIGPFLYIAFIIGALIFGLYYTHKKGMRLANIAVLCYAMIIIGYSSYAMVIIRSQADPAINENDPSTVEAFVSYLSRDQYGTSPLLSGYSYDNSTGNIDRSNEKLFPRRHSGNGQHLQYYGNFESDLDFFLSYQVNHMYLRYFGWNFIGKESDIQDAGWYSGLTETRHGNNPANSYYFYLPFLFGLFGLMFHFRNDWKRALSVLALFFLTGLAIIVYLNQTPFEPRERDYAYAGSFFAYSIWIGLGATGVIELIKELIGKNRFVAYGTLSLMIAAVPLWMGYQNWPSHDRSDNYVARDYAYNLLQSVEPNAILFTNGDNDTFPLWYLQEVEGIRTDVRVVVLSLLNTDWYIKQLRDQQSHESLPLPISFSDEEIQQFTTQYELHRPGTKTVPVDKDLLRTVFAGDTTEIIGTQITPVLENQIRSAVPYSIPVEELDDEVSWNLQGRPAGRNQQGQEQFYLQPSDIAAIEIIEQNNWLRPIYFANTVARDGQLGLEEYFQFEGKSFRLVPKEREVGPFGYIDPEVHAERLESFEFNEWNSPDVYFDENIRRMLSNYRYGFTQLADTYIRQGNLEQAAYWLKFGEDKIPFRKVENDWSLPVLYAFRYMRVEEQERANELSSFIAERLLHDLEYDIEELDQMEENITRLQERASSARADANMDRFRNLQTRAERETNQRDEFMNDISFTVSLLTILQNVYYETGNEEMAEELNIDVSIITDRRLQLPDNAEDSNAEVERFGLGI
ncbi:MAG: DUF2723 domain-containing protein [Balneolaceae bacterium]